LTTSSFELSKMRHDALNLLTRAIELKPFSLRALAVFSNNHQVPFAAYRDQLARIVQLARGLVLGEKWRVDHQEHHRCHCGGPAHARHVPQSRRSSRLFAIQCADTYRALHFVLPRNVDGSRSSTTRRRRSVQLSAKRLQGLCGRCIENRRVK
jgi:hypothetical protein